jgi:hypothetical protein
MLVSSTVFPTFCEMLQIFFRNVEKIKKNSGSHTSTMKRWRPSSAVGSCVSRRPASSGGRQTHHEASAREAVCCTDAGQGAVGGAMDGSREGEERKEREG